MAEPQTPDVPESISIGPSEQNGPVHDRLLDELYQRPVVRQELIQDIETALDGRTVVSFFTSFVYQVIIEDSDADMLESMLQHLDLSNGLCLILNSPGGDALAAERIIRVCRVYSNDNFEVLVPKAAKSAATMIALGSDCILMGKTAELGPIDPQVIQQIGGIDRYMPAHAVISSYDQLLEQAVNLPPGAHIEPFLQQLGRYNASEIEEMRKLRSLSEDIARRSLQSGMLRDRSEDEINTCVRMFTEWDQTLTRGRAIYPEAVEAHGLRVRVLQPSDPIWMRVFELYIRSDQYVSSSQACKTIEAARYSLSVPPPRRAT